jgi:CheY-like chemotaxis protein
MPCARSRSIRPPPSLFLIEEIVIAMAQQNPAIDRRSRSILGVDDSWEMQAILHAAISGAGYTYVAANSGDDALSIIAAREPFSVILLDVQMPGMDGFEVCKKIRALAKGRRVAIIFLTVNNTVADVEKCKAAGGNSFIVKPVNAKTLIRHLDHWSSLAPKTVVRLESADAVKASATGQ